MNAHLRSFGSACSQSKYFRMEQRVKRITEGVDEHIQAFQDQGKSYLQQFNIYDLEKIAKKASKLSAKEQDPVWKETLKSFSKRVFQAVKEQVTLKRIGDKLPENLAKYEHMSNNQLMSQDWADDELVELVNYHISHKFWDLQKYCQVFTPLFVEDIAVAAQNLALKEEDRVERRQLASLSAYFFRGAVRLVLMEPNMLKLPKESLPLEEPERRLLHKATLILKTWEGLDEELVELVNYQLQHSQGLKSYISSIPDVLVQQIGDAADRLQRQEQDPGRKKKLLYLSGYFQVTLERRAISQRVSKATRGSGSINSVNQVCQEKPREVPPPRPAEEERENSQPNAPLARTSFMGRMKSFFHAPIEKKKSKQSDSYQPLFQKEEQGPAKKRQNR